MLLYEAFMQQPQPKVVRSILRSPNLRLALYVLIAGLAAFVQEATAYRAPEEINWWRWLIICASIVVQMLTVVRAFVDQSISDMEKHDEKSAG